MSLLSLVLAAALPVADAAPVLDTAEQQRHDVLWDALWSVLDPDKVYDVRSLEARSLELEQRGFHCLTEVILEIKARPELFSEAELAEIEAALIKPTPRVEDGALASSGSAEESCFIGSEDNNFVYGERVLVEYEDGVTESRAENFLSALETSWDKLIDTHGWEPPEGSHRYLTLAYIADSSYSGAYTTVEWCSGYYVPYIVTGEGSFQGGSWYKTMAGHELNHASQFAYGFAHEFFWWEATATWSEEYTWPAQNDWANAIYVYSLVPHMGLNAFAGNSNDQYLFYHTYAMGIFGFYLDEYVGGQEFVRGTWEYSDTVSTSGYDLWLPDAIDGMGEDFDEVWTGFLAANTVAAYQESNYFYDPETEDRIRSLPADGESGRSTEPESLGANFIEFDGDLGGADQALQISFNGDGAVPWFAVIVRAEDDEVFEYVRIELDDNADGIGQLNFDGETTMYLVVSPMDEDAQGYYYDWTRADSYSYEWSAELVDAVEPEPEEGGGGGGGGGVDGDEDAGCACASSPSSTGLGWALLGGLALLGLRRRD